MNLICKKYDNKSVTRVKGYKAAHGWDAFTGFGTPKDDPNAIFGKFTDFSAESIDKLIRDGQEDANRALSKPN